jgi:hypothetical protein
MMEAVSTSQTLVYFNETTRRYIPESCHHRWRLFHDDPATEAARYADNFGYTFNYYYSIDVPLPVNFNYIFYNFIHTVFITEAGVKQETGRLRLSRFVGLVKVCGFIIKRCLKYT